MFGPQPAYTPPRAGFVLPDPFKAFTSPLSLQYDAAASKQMHRDLYRITQSFFFLLDEKAQRVVYVPAGYLTDGASVPRLFWGLIPSWGIYGQAAVVHDIVCESLTVFASSMPVSITYREADNILHAALRAAGVPAWKRWMIYIGTKVYHKFARQDHPTASMDKRHLELVWMDKHATDQKEYAVIPGLYRV